MADEMDFEDEFDNEDEDQDTDDDQEEDEDDFIQNLLEDDDDEGDDDQEEEEEEDEDPEKKAEGEERSEDEEEEEDEELESLLALANNEEEGEEEEEEEEDNFEVSDREVAAAVYNSNRYADWMDGAMRDGAAVDDSFAAMVGKFRVDPKMLTEQGIYNLGDMTEYMTALRENQDPDRIVLPDMEDEHERGMFLKEHFNIPLKAEEYPEEIFEDTYLSEKELEGERESLKEFFNENQFSEEQAMAFVERQASERENFYEAQRNDLVDYSKKQKDLVQSMFREDTRDVIKDINSFMERYGTKFEEEFRNDKVMHSSSFIEFMHRMINDLVQPGSDRLKQRETSIKTLSPQGLEKFRDGLMAQRDKYGEYAEKPNNPEDKKANRLHKKYKNATISLNAVLNEIRSRGLEDV